MGHNAVRFQYGISRVRANDATSAIEMSEFIQTLPGAMSSGERHKVAQNKTKRAVVNEESSGKKCKRRQPR